MDWRLLLDYLKVLIWPAVTVILGLTFRKQIARLSQRVDSVETPVGSLTFAAQAEAIAQEAENVEDALVTEIQESVSRGDAEGESFDSRQLAAKIRRMSSRAPRSDGRFAELFAVSETDPIAAVLGAWRELEIHASRATLSRISRQTGIVRAISEDGFLPDHLIRLTSDLMLIRNRVAHEGDASLTTGDAKAYVAAAETVSDALELSQTPHARYLRYERAVQGALLSLNLSAQKPELDRDIDFLVGDYDGVVGVVVKYQSRGPYVRHLLERVISRHGPSPVPVLSVTNAPIAESVTAFDFSPDVASVREVVQWNTREDNDLLMRALV